MESKIRVGAVSYMNAKPLIYGFEHGMMNSEIDLVMAHPSKIATMLLNKQLDIGLAPVAVIPRMDDYHIVSDYCIGCEGEVASVCLFSEVPLHEIKTVLLDYQSRTSSELLKILLARFWQIAPRLIQTREPFQHRIKGTTGALVIGDRALEQRKISRFIYDLGSAWHAFAKLPFVFAAWISNNRMDENFISKFNDANLAGLNRIPEIVDSYQFMSYDLSTYYNSNLSYPLDQAKMKGLNYFLSMLSTEGMT